MNLVLTKTIKKQTPAEAKKVLAVRSKLLASLQIMDGWAAVQGMWRNKKIDGLRFQKKMRREWV